MRTIGVVVFFLASISYGKALLDPALKPFVAGSTQQKTARVLVLTNFNSNQLQGLNRPAKYDRSGTIRYYQEVTRRSLANLLTVIQSGQMPGVRFLKAYWLNASFLAEVNLEGLRQLATQESVSKIYLNSLIKSEPIMNRKPSRIFGGPRGGGQQGALTYNFTSTGLDHIIKEAPQVTGQGVVVGVVDSGIDATHPALQGKVVSFYNTQTHSSGDPLDIAIHGTHISGIIAGSAPSGERVGIAPGAKLAVASVGGAGYAEVIEGMEWIIDRARNPYADKVRVVNASWRSDDAPDQELFYRAISAWEAAGILPVFSAGNKGTAGISHPHEYPGTIAVAAYGPDLKVAPFSSRGPAVYKGQQVQKPDLAAPGVGIRSTVPGGGYDEIDGTSEAAPHVTGTLALILQACPGLNPAQLREVLMHSLDPGVGQPAGTWQSDYGFGRLDSFSAFKLALSISRQQIQRFSGLQFISFSGTDDLQVGTVLAAYGKVPNISQLLPEWTSYKPAPDSSWMRFDEMFGD